MQSILYKIFLGGFSYARQIDMQPIRTPTLAKFYSCKKWVLQFWAKVMDGLQKTSFKF
jgi:hypothetical protein